MKSLVLFGLATLFMFKSALPYVEYHLNYDFIVTELCEQKDEEINVCNGQCHLSKKIQETTDHNAPTENKTIHLIDFCQEIEPITFLFSNDISVRHAFFYKNKQLSSLFLDLIDPPPMI